MLRRLRLLCCFTHNFPGPEVRNVLRGFPGCSRTQMSVRTCKCAAALSFVNVSCSCLFNQPMSRLLFVLIVNKHIRYLQKFQVCGSLYLTSFKCFLTFIWHQTERVITWNKDYWLEHSKGMCNRPLDHEGSPSFHLVFKMFMYPEKQTSIMRWKKASFMK